MNELTGNEQCELPQNRGLFCNHQSTHNCDVLYDFAYLAAPRLVSVVKPNALLYKGEVGWCNPLGPPFKSSVDTRVFRKFCSSLSALSNFDAGR